MNLMRKIATFQFTGRGIRIFGALFLLAGLMGAIQQSELTGNGMMTNLQLLSAIETDPNMASQVLTAMLFFCLEACAVPIYGFMLAEGAAHTSSFGKYYLRVLSVAVLSQIPYNLLMTGNLMQIQGLNPVFASVMALTMLYFFRRFPGRKLSGMLIKGIAVLGTLLWSSLLGISHGVACVLLTAVIWALREKPNLQTFAGVVMCFACSLFSLYYLMAPIGFLILHFYDGERGQESRIVNYGMYPAMLTIAAVCTMIL